jgi:hypothetical protein
MSKYVPHEISLKLKQLDFKERVLTYYEDGIPKLYHNIEGWDFNTSFLNCCSRPTFSEVFKWFRDNYSLGHEILCPYSSTHFGKKVTIINEGKFEAFITDEEQISFTDDDFLHNTYEEAELFCVKKLIEILEQNKSK